MEEEDRTEQLVDLWLYVSEDGQVRFPEDEEPSPFIDEPFVASDAILADANAQNFREFGESVRMDIGWRRFTLRHYQIDPENREWMGNSEERARFFVSYVKAGERRHSSSE